jgi:hypothetical protein
MSTLRRPFLYDRHFFVSVNLISCCGAGLPLKPASPNGERPLQQSWPFPRRAKRVATGEPQRQKAGVALHLSGLDAAE